MQNEEGAQERLKEGISVDQNIVQSAPVGWFYTILAGPFLLRFLTSLMLAEVNNDVLRFLDV
jgi:hypothetical protein